VLLGLPSGPQDVVTGPIASGVSPAEEATQ
jgi:hypothetical protein